MEAYSETAASYLLLEMTEATEADPTVPSFSKAALPMKMTLIAHLDRQRPLSEPRWVKTGDVQEWLKSMFGRMFWVAGDAAGGWEKKISVVDPDPVSDGVKRYLLLLLNLFRRPPSGLYSRLGRKTQILANKPNVSASFVRI